MIPSCCEPATEWDNLGGFSFRLEEGWQLVQPPERLRASSRTRYYTVAIRYCPWCGTELPKEEKS